MSLRLALLLALLLPAQLAAAEIYRCVNDDGAVSYTDNLDACPQAESTGIDSDPTDPSAVAAQRQQLVQRREALTESRSEARSQAAAEDADSDQRKQNCQTQRDWLQQMMNTPRMFTTDEATGQRTMLDDSQREAKLQDARDRVAAACRGD